MGHGLGSWVPDQHPGGKAGRIEWKPLLKSVCRLFGKCCCHYVCMAMGKQRAKVGQEGRW